MKKKSKTKFLPKRNVYLICIGSALLLLGTCILVFFTDLYEIFINNALKIGPNTPAFLAWSKTDPPLIMDIYLFNWTNPEDIYDHSIKPNFVQCGPYRFKEIKDKVNVTWNNNNTITYRHIKKFYFDEENSPKNLSDPIQTVNMIALSAAFKSKYWNYFSKKTLSFSLSATSSYYVHKTAGELLFDGYEDTFMNIVRSLPFQENNLKDRFGFFYGQNMSVGGDGVYNVGTSSDENYGKMLTWNYENNTSFYKGSCGSIDAYNGELYPKNRKRDFLKFFSSQMCRIVELNYEKDILIKDVVGYKYAMGSSMFDNGTLDPKNSCFCNGDCLPSGVLNVSACRQNSPIYLSLPHFYGGDPYYVNAVEGLNPEQDKHQLHIAVEPKTGIIIDLAARMQLNLFLQPIDDIRITDGFPKVMIPIFFFDQQFSVSDDLAPKMWLIQNLPSASKYTAKALIGIGTSIFVFIVFSLFCFKKETHIYEITKEGVTKEEIIKEEVPLRS